MRLVLLTETTATVYDTRQPIAVFELNDQTAITPEIIEELRTDDYDYPYETA